MNKHALTSTRPAPEYPSILKKLLFLTLEKGNSVNVIGIGVQEELLCTFVSAVQENQFKKLNT